MKTNSRFHRVVAFAFAAVFAAVSALAETYTWNAGSGDWDENSGAKWTSSTGTTGTVPGASDKVVIPAAGAAYTVTVTKPFSVASLDVGSKATLCFKHREENSVSGDIIIRGGANVTHTGLGNSSALPESYRVALVCGGTFTLEASATIDTTGKGYPSGGYGPGYIDGVGLNNVRVAHAATPKAGYCYGSVACPTNCGSGGGTSGGGAVRIRAGGIATVNGTISCDGGSGNFPSGTGGSVWLTAADLQGAGTIQARSGAPNSNYSGNGSGGRVAVHLTQATSFASWEAGGGKIFACARTTHTNQGAGTIYKQAAGETRETATLIVDNNNVANDARFVELGAKTDSSVIGNLIVCNKGHVQVIAGETVTIHGDLSTASDSYYDAAIVPGGTLVFAGAGASTITGNAKLPNVTCTTPGKVLRFGTGANDLFRVLDGATVTLQGTAANKVVLEAVDDGEWKMALPGSAVQNLRYLTVSGSDARSGALAVAYDSDQGKKSYGWNMVPYPQVGEKVTWNGSGGTEWRSPNNWTAMRAPLETDIVVIPSSAPSYPVLSRNGATVAGLSVASGAQLTLSGVDLTVAGDMANAGTLTFAGTERLTLSGNVDFTGGTVTPAASELRIVGGAAQRVNLGGTTLHDVIVRKTGGSVAFEDGFTANLLDVSQLPGLALTFAAERTVTCAELVLDGVTAASSAPGTMWNVAVSASADVRGVTVSDSRATDLKIYADMASSEGRADSCENWFFGSLAQTWTGAANDNKWGTAGNWDPAYVPGPTSRVAIAKSATITAAADAEVQNLIVGGPSLTVSVRFNGRFASGDGLDVRNGATLTFDKPVAVTNSVFVRAGGKLTHASQPNGNTEKYVLDLTCGGAFTLEQNGWVDANSKGFPNTYPNSDCSHASTRTAGHCYGSVACPTNCGAGRFSTGGGAVRIRAGGVVTVNGTISCDAGKANNPTGAGGSVWLTASDLAGSGTVQARGGAANSIYTPDGCGGRIAIYLTEATSFANWEAGGGKLYACAQSSNGGAGTIYKQAAGQTRETATLIVDGNNVAADGSFVELGAKTDSSVIGNLIVRNKGHVQVIAGETVTIYGDLTMSSDSYYDAAATPGGTFAFAGTGVSTITGSAALPNVTCTTPGKVLHFGTGASDNFTFHPSAVLTLQGSEEDPVVLDPADVGKWKMQLTTDCKTEVKYVSVSNSNASAGLSVLAKASEDRGGNDNWGFSGDTEVGDPIMWTGAGGNSLWTDTANWEDKDGGHRAPIGSDNVIIPKEGASPEFWPVLADGTTVQHEISVGEGGSLTLKNCTLYVTNSLAVAGRLVAEGATRIICSNAVDFAGGTFTPGTSTFRLEGPVDQSVNPGNCTFNLFQIEKNGGSAVFSDGFSAVTLDVLARVETTLAFAQDRTVTAANVRCRSVTNGTENTSALLTLASRAVGERWRIEPTGTQFFSGVRVRDSQAVIAATADALSVDGGNNANWAFGGSCAAWVGKASTDFFAAGNWYPAAVPGAATHVLIAPLHGETCTVALGDGAAFACASLQVGVGDGKAAVTSTRPLNIAGDFELGGNATVTLNSKQVPNTVGGNLIMRNGATLTHTALPGSADIYGVNVEVAHDITIEKDAIVNVRGRGFGENKGPGYISGSGDSSRAAYASTSADGYCYGSIFSPTNAGSGTRNAGGGTVRFVAGGTLQLDGTIACGLVPNESLTSSGGTGGSAWLTAGVLKGGGTVDARGRNTNSGYGGNGGRIAVHQTVAKDFSAWAGFLLVNGGWNNGGPGTLYQRSADEAFDGGTVQVVNDQLSAPLDRWCEFPVKGDNPKRTYKSAALDVGAYSRVKLTANVTVRDLVLSKSTAKLELGTNTLTVVSRAHKNGLGWAANATVTSNQVDGVWGRIVWKKPGFVISIR